MLIGVCGLAHSGKDELIKMLIGLGVIEKRYAFADPLKDLVNSLFGWSDVHSNGVLKEVNVFAKVTLDRRADFGILYEQLGLEKYKKADDVIEHFISLLGNHVNHGDSQTFVVSPRRAYQLFGTEVGRKTLTDSVWVDLAPKENTGISDIRFPNEYDWLKENDGVLIRVSRFYESQVSAHESENYVSGFNADFELENFGTIIEYHNQIKRLAQILIAKEI